MSLTFWGQIIGIETFLFCKACTAYLHWRLAYVSGQMAQRWLLAQILVADYQTVPHWLPIVMFGCAVMAFWLYWQVKNQVEG